MHDKACFFAAAVDTGKHPLLLKKVSAISSFLENVRLENALQVLCQSLGENEKNGKKQLYKFKCTQLTATIVDEHLGPVLHFKHLTNS